MSASHDPSNPDGELYIAVTGRGWRNSQFDIPGRLKSQLVSESIAGRAAMRRAAAGSAEYERAQRRVDDAECALGERTNRFDEARDESGPRRRASATARSLLRGRVPGDTVSVIEVASVIAPAGWSGAMAIALATFDELIAHHEAIDATQEVWIDAAARSIDTGRRIARGPAFD